MGQHTNRIGQEMGHDSRTSTETGQEMGQDSGTRYGTAHQTGQDKKCDMTEQKQDAGHEMGQDSWAGQKVGQKQDSKKKFKNGTDISTHSCCGWELAPSSWYVLTSVSGSETTRLSPEAMDT